MNEIRLPTQDAVQAFIANYPDAGERVKNLPKAYKAAVYSLTPLEWPARMDYDRPVRSAQVVVNFLSDEPVVFAGGRLICWTMAATPGYRDTQCAGLAVLLAIRECAKDGFVFPRVSDKLKREIESGLQTIQKIVDPSIHKTAEAIAHKAAALVKDWVKAHRPKTSFLTWIGQIS